MFLIDDYPFHVDVVLTPNSVIEVIPDGDLLSGASPKDMAVFSSLGTIAVEGKVRGGKVYSTIYYTREGLQIKKHPQYKDGLLVKYKSHTK